MVTSSFVDTCEPKRRLSRRGTVAVHTYLQCSQKRAEQRREITGGYSLVSEKRNHRRIIASLLRGRAGCQAMRSAYVYTESWEITTFHSHARYVYKCKKSISIVLDCRGKKYLLTRSAFLSESSPFLNCTWISSRGHVTVSDRLLHNRIVQQVASRRRRRRQVVGPRSVTREKEAGKGGGIGSNFPRRQTEERGNLISFTSLQ